MQELYLIFLQDLKMRGIRVRDDAAPLQPGEFRDVDAPGGNLKDAFYPLPYKRTFSDFTTVDGDCSSSRSTICFDCGYASGRWKSKCGSRYNGCSFGKRVQES